MYYFLVSREILNYATPPSPGVFFFFFPLLVTILYWTPIPRHILSIITNERVLCFLRKFATDSIGGKEKSGAFRSFWWVYQSKEWREVSWFCGGCDVVHKLSSFLPAIYFVDFRSAIWSLFHIFLYGNRFLILCNFSSLILIYARWVYFCIK